MSSLIIPAFEGFFNDISVVYYVALGGLAMLIYYLTCICEIPRLITGNQAFQQSLVNHCPSASSVVRPPVWCFSSIPQVLFSALRPDIGKVPYKREIFQFSDEGECALDWYPNNEVTDPRPILIILPGLVGSSEEYYAKRLSLVTCQKNGRSVVFNYRGVAGVSLKTPKTYCATYTDDIHEIVLYAKKLYPGCPIMACGISLGGMILFNYVAKWEEKCQLTAATVISPPWDVFQSSYNLERYVHRFLFNHRLAAGLIARTTMYREVFTDVLIMDDVEKSRTISDFDRSFIVPTFGYPDLHSYYTDASIGRKVHKVAIPLLAIAAEDDPFAPGESLPLDALRASQHVCMFLLKRGSHIAFLNGFLWPNVYSVADGLVGEFFSMISHEHEDCKQL
jgi:abhydrolase domain-containing protein 1/3